MEVKVIQKDEGVIFEISGEIDLSSSQSLKESIEKESSAKLVVDLTKVSYMDSSGLAVFIELLKKIRDKKGKLFFCGPSARIKSLLEITKLDKLFPVYKDTNEALAHLK